MLEEGGRVVVKGLHEVFITGVQDMGRLLAVGLANRRTAETKLNKCSSRSHSIFTITTHIKEATGARGEAQTRSRSVCWRLLAVLRGGARGLQCPLRTPSAPERHWTCHAARC